jgi:hypothetical protein
MTLSSPPEQALRAPLDRPGDLPSRRVADRGHLHGHHLPNRTDDFMNRKGGSTLLLVAPTLAAVAAMPPAAGLVIRPNALPPKGTTATSTRVHCGTA